MSKRQFLIVLGIWMMLFLFLGFPSAVDKIFALATGLLVIVIAFSHKSSATSVSSKDVPFVEHKNNSAPTSPITSTDSSMTS